MIEAVPRLRTVTVALPSEIAVHRGLAYSLWLPKPRRRRSGGVVILHGAGSCKENHHDFARAALAAGFAAIAFDQRGHGESEGPMDAQVLEDVIEIAGVLRSSIGDGSAPLALRGSSLGGYFAILAGPRIAARAVIAISPASSEGLRRGLRSARFGFNAEVRALDDFLASHPLEPAVASLGAPLLLLHAEGDEQVPVEYSRELARHLRAPGSRLIAVPGGHHRSVQHDPELQAVSLRFLERALGEAGG